MSWLEYLGLEYLLGDDNHIDFSGLGTGMVLIFGIVCWLIVAIFQGDLVDQGAAVFNLLASIILLVLTIIKYIKAYKKAKNNSISKKLFYVISSITVIVSFAYGMIKPYHTLLFNYDYKSIFSGIAMMFYPLIILNLLFPFFCESNKLGKKIEEGFETIGLALITLGVLFLLSQVVTLFVSFTGNEKFYQNFISYHNMNITEKRKNWEYDSVEDCIKSLLETDAQKSLENFENTSTTMQQYKSNGDTANYERNLLYYIHHNYPDGQLVDNNVSFSAMKWEDNYIVTYALRDKEYNKLYYVKFDYNNYKILDFVTKEYYDNIKTIEI